MKLPSISDLEEDIRKKRQAAEFAFRRNQDILMERRAQKHEMHQRVGVTPSDIARRESKLKEQRDRILAKKNAEREERMLKARKETKWDAETSLPNSTFNGDSGDDDAKTGANTSTGQHKIDDRRSMMRMALARRMKQELLESEEERLRKMQAEQFTELDRKLLLVERLRDENRIRELELTDAIAAQQTERFKNIQMSAAKLSSQNYD